MTTTNNFPNTFIIGAAKSGTTSLHEYLAQHPQVFMSTVKEPHFFSQPKAIDRAYNPWATTEAGYLQLFDGAAGQPVIGESSPSYLWSPEAPARISSQVPEARLIAILRDPIDRAYSHYLADRLANRQSLPFYEALLEDYHRPEKGWHVSHLYVELGLYCRQLNRFYQHFPAEQILVLLFDDLRQDPQPVLERLARFLSIDPEPMREISTDVVHNPHLQPNKVLTLLKEIPLWQPLMEAIAPVELRARIRNRFFLRRAAKTQMDPRAVSFLQAIYTPEMANLEELLGRPIPSLRKVWQDA